MCAIVIDIVNCMCAIVMLCTFGGRPRGGFLGASSSSSSSSSSSPLSLRDVLGAEADVDVLPPKERMS